MIRVVTSGTRCRIVFEGAEYAGFCGRGGTTTRKREGDGKTPLGTFAVRFGFYQGTRPNTALPMVKIHPAHRWVDDPVCPVYNRLVFGATDYGGEQLIQIPEYRLGLAVEYNRSPAVAGLGSAIFFHCGNRPTAGCIAAEESVLLAIIRRLDPNQTPLIRME